METTYITDFELSIRRSPYFYMRGDDPSNHNIKIGGSLKGTSVLRGLSLDEERKYLPSIINVAAADVNFNKECLDYWNNIAVKIPADGDTAEKLQGKVLRMKIEFKSAEQKSNFEALQSFEKKGDYITAFGTVIDGIADYALFKYCLVYGRVANNSKDVFLSPKIRFYLFSIETERLEKISEFKIKTDAKAKFIEILNTEAIIDAALLFYDEKPSIYESLEDKQIALDKLIEDKPRTFMSCITDVNLRYKALILRAKEAGILYVPQNTETYYYGENREICLGTTLEDAVLFVKSEEPKNKEIVTIIQARLKA